MERLPHRFEPIESRENEYFIPILPLFLSDELESNPYEKINKNKISDDKLIQSNYLKEKIYKRNNDIYYSRDISYEILESPPVQENIDRFIIDAFNRIPENLIRNSERRHSPTVYPLIPNSIPDSLSRITSEVNQYFSSLKTGLRVCVSEGAPFNRVFRVGGNELVASDNRYGRVDFTPDGRASFSPAKMTDSIVKGVQGLVELLEAGRKGELELPELLYGNTNINMALVAQRLGFVIVDDCRDEEGRIDKGKDTFTVVGKMKDIKDKIAEFQEKGRLARLQERHGRTSGQTNLLGSLEQTPQFS